MTCVACGCLGAPTRSLVVRSDTDGRDYQVDFCECGMGRTSSTHIEEVCSQANHSMYDSVEGRISIYFHRLHRHFIARFNETLRIVGEFSNGAKRYLEIGSNIGFTADLARKAGFQVSVCELNQKCREASTLIFDLEPHPDFFGVDGEFDILMMCDVLEHFPDPTKALRKAWELLAPGGILFVQLPNYASREASRSGANWKFFGVPDHVTHFTDGSLKGILRRNGFEPVWSRTVGFLEDKFWLRFLPSRIRRRFLAYADSFLFIGFIPAKGEEGPILQMIARKSG
ncbi:MAG: class I SAM-dependent methyltransferase [Fibrobacterota bacterium]